MRRDFLRILAVLALVGWACAGETGKIVGRVVDAQTGDPLPGANVYIEGTTLGAATDVDGFFMILHVPPGTYDVTASMVGYAPMTVKGVRVIVDLTTEVNFQLKPEAIEVEPVVVTAREPVVRKDETSTMIVTDRAELRTLPVEDVSQVISIKAGITQDPGGGIHIRGGRSNEVAYYLDGIPITDPYLSSQGIQVATNTIGQLELIAGTFNAEYGNAMSGVINVVTREGGPKLEGYVEAYSGDKVSTHTDYFPHVDRVNPLSNKHLRWSLSGPLGRSKLRFFLGGNVVKDEGWLFGVNKYLPTDTQYDSTGNGDGSLVPMNPYEAYQVTGKLTLPLTSNIKLNFTGVFDDRYWREYNSIGEHRLLWEPLANPHRFRRGYTGIVAWNHILSPTLSYSARVGYVYSQYRSFVYEDYYCPCYHFGYWGYFVSEHRFYQGGVSRSWFKRYTKNLTARLDLSWQATRHHFLKTGLEAIRTTVHRFSLYVTNPDTTPPALPIRDTIYDINQYTHHPVQYAAYIQDKMEFRDLIVNAGIRLDYFDPQWKVWNDDLAPSPMIWADTANPFPGYHQVDPKWQISPRLGLAFPISETGVFHFSYGHFFQIPPLYYLYRNSEFEWASKANRTVMGNADLKPQQTIAYEVGFKQAVGDHFGVEITGYYKDIRNLLATKLMPSLVQGDHYMTYINNDYGNVRGVSVYLKLRNLGHLSAEFDYTLQVAEGLNSAPRDLFADLRNGVEPPRKMVPLDWDERHRINATVSYTVPRSYGISLIASYGSGLPYTPTDTTGNFRGEFNSARRPAHFNVDLHAYKEFHWAGKVLRVFAKVYNVLDRMNERYVYTDTGRATHTYMTRPTADPGYYKRPYYFSPPREVRLGLALNF